MVSVTMRPLSAVCAAILCVAAVNAGLFGERFVWCCWVWRFRACVWGGKGRRA